MSRIRKWIQRDRFGVVRGTLLLGVVMLLCTYMVIRLFYSYDIIVEEERASESAKRVAAQFELLIDNSLNQLNGAAKMLEEDILPVDDTLDRIVKAGNFSEGGLLRDGNLYLSDGTKIENAEYRDHIRYDTENLSADLLAETDGRIHLCVPLSDGSRLVAWVKEERVEAVLCNAFIEDYGYAVYNAATGAYLVNHTGLDDASYFDSLRGLNQNANTEQLLNSGDAHARIERSDTIDDNYYIAQQLTNIRPLGISLFIPENLVQSEAWSGRIMPQATMIAAGLMLLILISYTVFSLRRVHIDHKKSAKDLAIGERMMNLISREARITLFMLQRKQEKLSYCYDGLSLLESGGIANQCSLDELEKACGMDESEAERLHDSLRELEPGDSSELLIHTVSQNHEKRVLRFTLFASSKAEQGTICCISDCTQELASLDRIELERGYQASVQTKASSIWQINISRNRWKSLKISKQSALHDCKQNMNVLRDYNADLDGLLRDRLHPADYSDFAETMSAENIASMFHSGKTEFVQDYRVCKAGGGDYEWHRMNVRIWLNPETNDIFANLYVFNVNAEKNAELERGERKKILHQALTALGGIYCGLYYVDLENNLCYTARSLGGDLVTELCAPYDATFNGYVDNSVHPDDQEGLRKLLNAYNLRKHMTEGSHFIRREYRRKSGDGYEQAAIIVQAARFENGIVKEVVLAIRYIGHDKDLEI